MISKKWEYTTETKSIDSYDRTRWNNGVCYICGGELMFDSCGDKYHFKCNTCDREFIFNELQPKK